jgi:chorismate dehydratase
VGSVLLFSRTPINKLDGKKIYLTCQSATSINLLHVILEHFSGMRPEYETGNFDSFDADANISAYLAIGDEALRLRDMETGLHMYDLAEIWIRETGLPFVFAVWAVRKKSWEKNMEMIRRLHAHLNLCLQKGRNNLEEISASVAGRIPMSVSDCTAYLRGIELDLSPEKEKGLMEFFRLVGKIRHFPEITEILKV